MHRLIIQGKLDGLNEYQEACRTKTKGKWNAGNANKQRNDGLVIKEIKSQLKGIHLDKRIRLDIKWYEPNRRRDPDNIAFAKKYILDALRKADVIENDGWRNVQGFSDEFYIDKQNPRIEVYISEVDHDAAYNTITESRKSSKAE